MQFFHILCRVKWLEGARFSYRFGTADLLGEEVARMFPPPMKAQKQGLASHLRATGEFLAM